MESIKTTVTNLTNDLIANVSKADTRDWYEDKPSWEEMMSLRDRLYIESDSVEATRKYLEASIVNLEDLDGMDPLADLLCQAHALAPSLADMVVTIKATLTLLAAEIDAIEDAMETVRKAYAHLPEGAGSDTN